MVFFVGVRSVLEAVLRKIESVFHRFDRVNKIAQVSGKSRYGVYSLLNSFAHDRVFFLYITQKMERYHHFTPSKYDFDFTQEGGSVFFPCVTLYGLVSALKPQVVVETGGTPGKSSAGILKAMRDNNVGHLFTLDLPPVETHHVFSASSMHQMRPVDDISCWAIEPSLRDRHTLILGDAKETLPALLSKLGVVDIFIHDSDHSYQHMMFEFETSWPFVKKGGLVMSDDIRTNESFFDFARTVGKQPFVIGNYGIIVK